MVPWQNIRVTDLMFAFQVLRPKSNIFSTEIEKNLYTQLYLQVLCCGTREKQQF